MEAAVPSAASRKAHDQQQFVIRLEVDDALSHGVAAYGGQCGRYPLGPSLVCVLHDE